jgi:hypothetical protein
MKEAKRTDPAKPASEPTVSGGEVLDDEGLTPAQRLFADHYVHLTCEPGERTPGHSAAVKAAVPKQSASVMAHKWLRTPAVTNYISRALRPAIERVDISPDFLAFEALTGLRKAQADGHHAAAARYLEILDRIQKASKLNAPVGLTDVDLSRLSAPEVPMFLDMLRRIGMPVPDGD